MTMRMAACSLASFCTVCHTKLEILIYHTSKDNKNMLASNCSQEEQNEVSRLVENKLSIFVDCCTFSFDIFSFLQVIPRRSKLE